MQPVIRRYVLGFYLTPQGVVLIRKSKPEWAKGKLNGIGGHIEEGETPLEAMVREFDEEAGIKSASDEWTELLTLRGDGTKTTKPWEMVVFSANTTRRCSDWPREIDEGEVNAYDYFPSRFDMDPTADWLLRMVWNLRSQGIALDAALQAPAQGDGVGADGLLPCPFCGSARGEWFVNYADVLGVYVSCNECGARTDYLKDIPTAIAAWNRRHNEEPTHD